MQSNTFFYYVACDELPSELMMQLAKEVDGRRGESIIAASYSFL